MPFGLCNAPSTSQRTMNDLLRDCREFAQVYIDDMVFHSASLEDHVTHIKKVLTIILSEKLYAKRKKCIFEAQLN